MVLAAVAIIGVSARAATVPDGYEGAKLGMSEESVRKLFPEMKQRFEWPDKGGEPEVRGWILTDRTVGPFAGCNVEFRFFRGELYYVSVAYADPAPADMQQWLEKIYGPAKAASVPATWAWDATVLCIPKKINFGSSAIGVGRQSCYRVSRLTAVACRPSWRRCGSQQRWRALRSLPIRRSTSRPAWCTSVARGRSNRWLPT